MNTVENLSYLKSLQPSKLFISCIRFLIFHLIQKFMSKKEDFIQSIIDGYTSKGASLLLGGAILDGEAIAEASVKIPLKTLNRHGLIAGATGTGKTKIYLLMVCHVC